MKQSNFIELPFIGREYEIKMLNDKLDATFSNHGYCMLITGEPGIGKSRLVDEFLSRQKKEAFTLRISIASGNLKIREITGEVIRTYLRKTAPVARIVTKIIDEAMYREFKRSIPELNLYYPYEAEAIDHAGERPNIKEILYRFLNNLSMLAPIILVVDDIDGACDDMLELVEYLLPNISAMPLLLVLTGSGHQTVSQWLGRVMPGPVEVLPLGRLDEIELLQINHLLFHDALGNDFFRWISEKTRGVPLFLREFLFALFERGIIFYDGELKQWRAIESYAQVVIPDRIGDMVELRLKRLSADEKALLAAASVIGIVFDPQALPLKNKKELLPSLVRAGFITKRNGNYSFAHPLVRDILYAGVPEQVKNRMHRELALTFETRDDLESAAEHYLAAGIRNKKVLELLLKTARRSLDQGNYDRSIHQYEQAVDATRVSKILPPDRLLKMNFELCSSLFLGEQYERVFELSKFIDRHLARTRRDHDAGAITNYYSQLIQSLMHLGKYQKALVIVRKALQYFEKAKLPECNETKIEIASYKAFIYKSMGNVSKAMDLAIKLQKTYGETASAMNRYNIYKLLGSLITEKKDFKRAIEFRGLALEAARETGAGHLVAAAQGNLGVSLTTAGQLQRGTELMRSYQDFNIRAGRVRAEIVSYIHMAQIYFNQGFLTQAEAEYKKGLERGEKQGAHFKEVLYELHYRYGTFLIVAERYAEARRYLESAISIAREIKAFRSALFPLLNLGCLHVALKKRDSLDRVINEIKTTCRDEYKTDITFAVLEGFQSIFQNRVKQGLYSIEKALDVLEQKQIPAGLFRLLYLCMKYLGASRNTCKEAEKYRQKAQVVASKYELSGWLNMLVPESTGSIVEQLRFHCFGRFWIEHPQKGLIDVTQLQRVKPVQLLSILINGILTKTYYTREKIGSLLWPEFSAEKMINNFHVCLSQLKEQIGADYIHFINGKYLLANVWLDVFEFKNLINKGEVLLQEGKVHVAELKFEEALDLYKGEFLEDVSDPWTDEVRGELAALYNQAQLMLGEIYIKKLKFEKAVRIGRSILGDDAYNEEGHRFLIKSYALNGERAKAVSQYKKCVELFRRELDCEPSEETRNLYRKIQKQ